MTGDLTDGQYIRQLKYLGIKNVLCSNAMKYVENQHNMCVHLEEIVPSGGIITVTVPYRYPYHKDPIDTKFRPSSERLYELFPNSIPIKGKIVTSSGTQVKSLWKKLRKGKFLDVFNTVKRWILPLRGMDEWRKARKDIPHFFKSYQTSCVILQKNEMKKLVEQFDTVIRYIAMSLKDMMVQYYFPRIDLLKMDIIEL